MHPEKVEAIRNMDELRNIPELRRFPGKINYLEKIVKDMSVQDLRMNCSVKTKPGTGVHNREKPSRS